MVQLANAWVTIKPSTREIAPAIKKALGESYSNSEKSGQEMGSRLSSGISKTLKRGALAAGAAAGTAIGYTLKKGFDRLSAIEGAEAKLKGLGHSTQSVGKIMDSALSSVKGTAFGLGDAAGLAAQMVASGIKPGQELETVLKTVGDTATIAGRDIGDMGLIFGSVAARGKLQGDDMMQLMSSGIPVLQLLAEETGKTSAEVSDMVSKGQIDFATFERAMRGGMGGAALEAGNTFTGAIANAKAAIGRLGEAILQDPFNAAPAVIGNATKAIDGLTDKVKGAFEYLEKGGSSEAFKKAFPDPAQAQAVSDALDRIKNNSENFKAGIQGQDASGIFGALGESTRKLGEAFATLAPSVGKILASLGQGAMAASVVSITTAFATLAPLLANVLAPILETIANLMTENQGAVNALVTSFVAFKGISFVGGLFGKTAKGFKMAGDAGKFLSGALRAGGGIGNAFIKLAGGAKSANPIIAAIGRTFTGFGKVLVKVGNLSKVFTGAFSKVGAMFAKIGPGVAKFAGVLKSGLVKGLRLAATGFRALTAVIMANPMVAIAAAIAAVVAGLVWFFTKTETGKRIWGEFVEVLKSAWEWLSTAFAAVWSTISEKATAAWESIKNAWSGVGEFFSGIWDGLTSGASSAWEGVKNGFSSLLEGVQNVVNSIREWLSANWPTLLAVLTGPIGLLVLFIVNHWEQIKAIFTNGAQMIGQIWSTLWNGLVSIATTIWNGIIATLTAIWNGLVSVATTVWGAIRDGIVATWNGLTSIASAVWNGIKTVIVSVWNGIKTAVVTIWNGLSTAISNGWNLIRGLAGSVWNGIKNIVTAAWNAMVTTVINVWNRCRAAITIGWNFIKSLASTVWNGIKTTVLNAWNGMTSGIKRGVQIIRDAVSSMVNFCKDRFNDLVRKVQEIPGKIKSAFSSAGNWLKDAGRNLIQGFADGIRSATGWIVDAIKSLVPDSLEHFLPFADGGFFFARGGVVENHQAMIARAGSGKTPFRVWAEPETGGEAYIPLAPGKRSRSTAILAAVADKFGLTLAGRDGYPLPQAAKGNVRPQGQAFANGGLVTPGDMLKFARGGSVRGFKARRPLQGAPYVFGGSNWGDCSGTTSAFAALAVGQNPFPRKYYTGDMGSWLPRHGFKSGIGPRKNNYSVGYFNGGQGGGHTAASIWDGNGRETKIEMGGAPSMGHVNTGVGATHKMFKHHFHLTLKADTKGKPATKKANTPAAGSQPVDMGAPAGVSSGGSTSVQWGKAQELYTQAADYLGVGRASYAARQEDQAAATETAATPAGKAAKSGKKATPKPGAKWGQSFFVYEIARSAKSKKLPSRGAMIGVGTALVESGDPMKMWANRAVPESLKYRHDAIGSDHDSVGLFQQRNNGAWGTTADRMNPFRSAGMFFSAMLKKFPQWASMAPGAVAQGVQVSAFPSRYAGKMDKAMSLVKQTRLYDKGGVLPHRGMSVNLSKKPEAVLTNQQWANFARSTRASESLVDLLRRGAPEFQAMARKGPDAWMRTAAAVEKIAFSGDYTGREPFDEDSVFTDIGLRLHDVQVEFQNAIDGAMDAVKKFGMAFGGGFIGKAEIVRDAERGLEETREQIAAETVKTAELEQDLAKARRELVAAQRKGGVLTKSQSRRIADAEEALAKARKVKKADKRAEAIAKAQKRLDRANEDASDALDKSKAKNAKDVQKAMDKVSKAESKLTEAQLKQTDAALRLEAAERTVAAARYKAVGDLATGVLESVAKGAETVAKYAEAMTKLSAEVEKTQQEVSKLAMANVNNRIATMEAVNGLRTSETDLAKARWDGYIAVARAEAELAKERKGHLEMGAASVTNLADAVDRFRVAGVEAVDDILLTWVSDQNLVLQAEWALKQARAEAALSQQEAVLKQQIAQFNLAAATMEQAHIAEQLRLQTALLAQQQAVTFGVGAGQMGALQRMGQAVQKIFTGIAKIIGGIATAVAGFAVAGPLGALPGVIAALSGIPDIAGGIAGAKANRKEAKKAWKGLDKGAKATAGLGIAGAALSGAAGIAAGTAGGLGPEAITGGLQVGNAILDASFGSLTQVAEAKMEALTAEHNARMEKMQRDYEMDKAILDSQKAGLQAGTDLAVERLKLDVETAKLQKELAKAKADKEDEIVVNALERAVAEATARQRVLASKAGSNRAQLDAASEALANAARDAGRTVNITLTGDGYTSSQVEGLLNRVASEYGDMDLRVKRLEDKDSPGALAYAAARR
ncbi:tape measure protein [Corynebacterium macclintockiae]|uniref:tape measure protein n=1 Tax=Corynebacterium macclintockiae TaxID=2913501 RepID=UPI003EBACB70